MKLPQILIAYPTASRRSLCGERGLKSLKIKVLKSTGMSLPLRGAWIEIGKAKQLDRVTYGRSLCGERGLKWWNGAKQTIPKGSLPLRGAWIEINALLDASPWKPSRSLCGERGLKSAGRGIKFQRAVSRSLCGERGLKYRLETKQDELSTSLPLRGAWIEMTSPALKYVF